MIITYYNEFYFRFVLFIRSLRGKSDKGNFIIILLPLKSTRLNKKNHASPNRLKKNLRRRDYFIKT